MGEKRAEETAALPSAVCVVVVGSGARPVTETGMVSASPWRARTRRGHPGHSLRAVTFTRSGVRVTPAHSKKKKKDGQSSSVSSLKMQYCHETVTADAVG